MTFDPRALSGKRVIIIEDDYYQSRYAVMNIEQAGGTVVASTADANEACALISRGQIDIALVDINLGCGPSFKTARALRDHGIPFVFTTGYDEAIVPEEFHDVTIIQKPHSLITLLSALVQIA